MSKKTKKQKEHAKFALRRLTEDEQVHSHLRTASMRVREAWARAARRPGSEAVQDKKVYDNVRKAATSLTKAGSRMRPQPEPKHRGRNAALTAAAVGGAAYALNKRRSRSTGNGSTVPATAQEAAKQTREPAAGRS
jgi:hypothetical protein